MLALASPATDKGNCRQVGELVLISPVRLGRYYLQYSAVIFRFLSVNENRENLGKKRTGFA